MPGSIGSHWMRKGLRLNHDSDVRPLLDIRVVLKRSEKFKRSPYMRSRRKSNGVSVSLIAGTHVVLIGLDLDPSKRPGCLGFAIQREDHTENERNWMTGMKTF